MISEGRGKREKRKREKINDATHLHFLLVKSELLGLPDRGSHLRFVLRNSKSNEETRSVVG